MIASTTVSCTSITELPLGRVKYLRWKLPPWSFLPLNGHGIQFDPVFCITFRVGTGFFLSFNKIATYALHDVYLYRKDTDLAWNDQGFLFTFGDSNFPFHFQARSLISCCLLFSEFSLDSIDTWFLKIFIPFGQKSCRYLFLFVSTLIVARFNYSWPIPWGSQPYPNHLFFQLNA